MGPQPSLPPSPPTACELPSLAPASVPPSEVPPQHHSPTAVASSSSRGRSSSPPPPCSGSRHWSKNPRHQTRHRLTWRTPPAWAPPPVWRSPRSAPVPLHGIQPPPRSRWVSCRPQCSRRKSGELGQARREKQEGEARRATLGDGVLFPRAPGGSPLTSSPAPPMPNSCFELCTRSAQRFGREGCFSGGFSKGPQLSQPVGRSSDIRHRGRPPAKPANARRGRPHCLPLVSEYSSLPLTRLPAETLHVLSPCLWASLCAPVMASMSYRQSRP